MMESIFDSVSFYSGSIYCNIITMVKTNPNITNLLQKIPETMSFLQEIDNCLCMVIVITNVLDCCFYIIYKWVQLMLHQPKILLSFQKLNT